jgi:biopolymer transport protein ExbB
MYIKSALFILLVPVIAIAQETTPETISAEIDWFHEMTKGGVTGIVLFALAFVMVTIALERLINLRTGHIVPPNFTKRVLPLWKEGKFDELKAVCLKAPSTMGRMTSFLVEHRALPAELLIQGASDIGIRELLHEQKRSYGLAVIAGLAPLLGLLGTIIGMIESFKLVEIYGDEGGATILAGSISKALITTALGLIIAIPSMALYHWFKYKIQVINKTLDEQVEVLINEWLLKSMQVSGASLAVSNRHTDSTHEVADTISFFCTECRQKLKADPDMAGTSIACPRCGTSLKIPSASGV